MILRIIFIFFLCFSTMNFGQGPAYENQINLLLGKGYDHYSVQKDSGQYYFKKIERLAIAKKDTLTVLDILITSNRHLGYFYDLSTIRENLVKIDNISSEKSHFWQNLEDSLLYRNSIRVDKGNFYFKLGNNNRAKSYFNAIKNSYQNQSSASLPEDHFLLLSNSMSFLAKTYQLENKFELAKDYYEQIINLVKTVTPEDRGSLYINFALLAEVLTEQGEYEKANSYLLKTIKDALKQNTNPNRIISVAHHLAVNYMTLSKLDSTRHYLNIMANHLERSPNFKELYHRTKAKLERQNNNLESALNEIDLALETYLGQPGELNNKTLANLYLEKGDLLVFAEDYENALKAANEGLDIIPSKFGTTYLELIGLSTSSLLKLKKFNEVSISAFSAVKTLDSLKADYQYSSDKINLIEKTFPLFESALEANYSRFTKTGNTEYLDEAFFFMEKSKSVLLLEALMAAKANQFAQVPDSLLEKERLLRSEITAIEKELLKNTSENTKLKSDIFHLKEQQSNLMKMVSSLYPEYYNLRYGGTVIGTTYFSEALDPAELLISYFYGNNAIYAISLGHQSKNFIKIPLDQNLENTIKSVHQMFSDPKSDMQILASSTNGLFSTLIQPLLTSKETTRLTLITDGLLNYLPFSALNTNPDGLSYLVEDFAVSYASSATLLKQLKDRQPSRSSKILAFAPSFDGTDEVSLDRSKLLPLPHNTKEVTQILKSFNGRSYLDKEASLENFKTAQAGFNILHLATHAVFDDTMPEYSYLAFAQDGESNEGSVLFVSDLYNLNTDVDLVTLSACESGIGELKRGEGFLSLARGFFYSGAASLTSTLWKINDASSATVMEIFYDNLSKGETKDLALQQAKKTFLKSNRQNALAHPYYWSGFVVSGNTSPLVSSNEWLWLISGIVILSISLGMFFSKRRKN